MSGRNYKFTPKERKEIMQYIIHNNWKTLDQFAKRFNVSRQCITDIIKYYETMYGRTFYRKKKGE